VGMDPARAGTIISTSLIADAIVSAFVGRFSDNLRSKYGRRRPLILFSAFVLPASFTACYYNFQSSPETQVMYYLFFGLLFWASYAVFFVTFTALGADVATDYDDRIRMISLSRIFSVTGDMFGSAAPLTVTALLVGLGFAEDRSWFLFAMGMSVLVFLGIMTCWNSTRGRERVVTSPAEPQGLLSTLKDYRDLLTLKPYRTLIYSKVSISFSFTTYSTCMVYYVIYRMRMEPTFISSMYVVTNLIKMGFIVVVAQGALRFGKKELLVASTGAMGLVALLFIFRGIDSKAEMYVYIIGCVYAQAAYWQLSNTNFYDVTDLDEYRYGKRREGNLMALQSLIAVLSIAMTHRLTTWLLAYAGFDARLPEQAPGAIAMLERIFILLPAIGMLVCAYFLLRYRVNKKRFALLAEQLYRREQGLESLPQADIDQIEWMFQ